MTAPCRFVIFGAAGHLARTKLLPALYDLELAGRLPSDLALTACARRSFTADAWRDHLLELLADQYGAALDTAAARRLALRFHYVIGDHEDPELYQRIGDLVASPDKACRNAVFYLAVPPDQYATIVAGLQGARLNQLDEDHRVVVEKPFGRDAASAHRLNELLHRHYDESQIFRIDHYLGKETVQNLFVFRFANAVIEPLWNRHHIDHVQILMDERAGIDTRAGYYDDTGALRDMVQSHLLQVLALVAMEPPATLEADALHAEKAKVLRSIRPVEPVDPVAVRGRYAAGQLDGNSVPGYLEERGVSPRSTTDTFVALKLYVDNWRWQGVPFYLRTGKRLAATQSRVAIRFRDPPHRLFQDTLCANADPNWLILSIQPEETVHFELQARQPGLRMVPRLLRISASPRDQQEQTLNAYASLILGIIEGDRSLFIRFDEVELAWQVLEPVMAHWAGNADHLHPYAPGTWGPPQANALFDQPHQGWRNQP